MTQQHPLRSVHTSSLPEILRQLNCSLVVATYQAGRVILVRYEEGEGNAPSPGRVNTHFRQFDRPMGVCEKDQRLSIGGTNTVWEFHNVPGAAAKLEPEGKHDGCFVPRAVHFTGDIDIHEMSWSDDDQLWLVNTRFSCLCTLERNFSFQPRWRPHFVSALSPEDRCHLNGLALRDGKPRYVTALGETDTRGGWRANKANGGLLMDVENNQIILRGLSMPHSPRWYRDRLWVLESGRGSLCYVDPRNNTLRTVARLPGFTRGLDFYGPLAFIGLSKIREKAVFSGIPIATELTERVCGVWVVNIETGDILAFLRFESGVEEVFAVQILRGMRYPEMLTVDDPLLSVTYVLPDEALADVALPTQQELDASAHGAMARGIAHLNKRDFASAVTELRACLAMEPDFPNARYSLGIALAQTGALKEAVPHVEAAREQEPDRSEIHVSLGSLYQRMGAFDKAQAAFEAAILREPQDAVAHESLGVLLLTLGEYPRGLDEYQWRLKTGQVPSLRSPHPTWDGTPAPDKRVLVYLEHDDPRRVVLLARYLPRLARLCGKLIVTCPDHYAPLLATLQGVADIRGPGEVAVSEFDTHVSLESLPYYLGISDEILAFRQPYLDVPTLTKRSAQAPKLGAMGKRKCGLVLCNDGQPLDEQRLNRLGDELIGDIADNVRRAGFELYLVTDPMLASISQNLASAMGLSAATAEIRNLSDLAITVEQLDLVIGVDSPAVHLAGALGKPAWVVLGLIYDWCWPARGSNSPWYPTAKVFRKGLNVRWAAVAEEIQRALTT